MSIYSGTKSEQEYAHGRDDGRYAGDYALELGLGVVADDLTQAREAARVALSRRDRTYWTGYLRGYREAVRTLNDGRWGT